MKFYLILLYIIFPITCISQNLNCADFRSGIFTLNNNSEFELYFYSAGTKETTNEKILPDPKISKYVIERNILQQTEWSNEIGYGSPTIEEITWTDTCSYNLKYLVKEDKLDDKSIAINENGGLHVEILEIIGNCMQYKSSLKFPNGDEIFNFGEICKKLD